MVLLHSDLLSLWFFLLSSQFSPIGCFLPFLDSFSNGIFWDRFSRNSQLSLAVFSGKGEKASAWPKVAGGMERGRRVWERRSHAEVLRKEEFDWRAKELKTWKRWEGKVEALEKEVGVQWLSRSVETEWSHTVQWKTHNERSRPLLKLIKRFGPKHLFWVAPTSWDFGWNWEVSKVAYSPKFHIFYMVEVPSPVKQWPSRDCSVSTRGLRTKKERKYISRS